MIPAPMPEARPVDRMRATSAGLTDVGRQRRHNEDHVLVKPDLDLFVVADGMGGHNAGDVASKLAAKSLHNFFEATEEGADPGEPTADEIDLTISAQRLAAGVRKANHDVFEISSTFQQHQGMGSTVVAAHYAREIGMMHFAHVGDSRAYRVRGGEIEQLTRDHSLINDALELKPDLKPEEIARLPRNIITRALGMKDLVKVDVRSEHAELGDLFLLCSDGLSGMITDEQILEIVSITDDLGEACELLIAMANDAGGSDNITAVLIRIEEAPPIVDVAPSRPPATSEPDNVETAAFEPLQDLAAVVTPEVARALEGGAEIDISTPSSVPPKKVNCPRCEAEIISGNTFCVECGARV
jgi:PPM family protein phosphatase